MRKMPETAAEAYEVIRGLAEKAGESMSAYCQTRNVAHTTVMRWQNESTTYRQDVFLRLIGKD